HQPSYVSTYSTCRLRKKRLRDLSCRRLRSRTVMVGSMGFVRFVAPGSIALATLLMATAPAAAVDAAEQNARAGQLDAIGLVDGVDQAPRLSENATPHQALRAGRGDPGNCAPSSPTGDTALRPGPRGRPFLTALGAIPLVTYAGATGPRASELLTPADRFAMSQLIGVGYVVNPRFRFGAMGIFNEVLTGLPRTADAWQFGGIAPIAIGTFGHLIIGGGPIFGYRSGGTQQSDFGAVVLSGASLPLKKGLALNVVVPTTSLFSRRVTVSAGVAIGVAKVF